MNIQHVPVRDLVAPPIKTREEFEKVADLWLAQAREEFWAFRKLMRPNMHWGWFIEDVALHLQKFYADFVAGRRPRLALMAPPQHGKSWTVTDFIAWMAGKRPDFKTIFASFSDDLGVRTNLDVKRMIQTPLYQRVFPNTRIDEHGWICNSELIEFVEAGGSFRNTTIEGQINGKELHLGVIDDPLKGRAEAESELIREKSWHWFADDFMSRFNKDGALLVIMTRWHVDDLLGRYQQLDPTIKMVSYPAIATRDEYYRMKGEALFPNWKPLDFLENRKSLMTEASWQSEYQQNPFIPGGGQLPIEKMQTLPFFDPSMVEKAVRSWDKAGTQSDDAAYTAGALMCKLKDGRFVLAHMVRGRWGALDREKQIKMWAEQDRAMLKHLPYEVIIEQEPGSGGKESAEATIRMLAGFRVYADKVTGKKEVRAEPFCATVQGGNLWLLAGSWHRAWFAECEAWPHGEYMDQVDAAAQAFNRMATGYSIYGAWTDR